MTVVFDGWQGGWNTEKRERRREVEIIYSKLGEKADEVIKRLLKEKGSEAMVITSDQDISRFAERLNVAVILSEQFMKKLEASSGGFEKSLEEEEEERGMNKKGLSRRLSKREKRARAALKKL
jgi:predicted RNA-binding protein with PIN domain